MLMLEKIEHIGIAVKRLDEAIEYYENVLGLTCYAIEEVKDQGVRTAFFKIGEVKIELLEPMNDNSPVAKFITKRGEGIHHIAFATSNVKDTLQTVGNKGIQLIDKIPRKGAEGLQIGFLHPKSTFGVLTEICGKE